MPGTDALRVSLAGEHTYVWTLSALQLTTGFLTIGLVRPWGEQIRGIRVPRALPIGVGTAGGLAVTYLFTIDLVWKLAHGQRPDEGLVQGGALVVLLACYAPIVLWGPLELVSVAGYALRTRRRRRALAV
ncbi:hypothetical protein G9U51_03315 [Calidifontibacter sp. DB0510]|uniref:Uncharacterized protein n=1 Tax=Metallococcus carri TaxID=1656884 RepID=A0A967E839_9MICO|nr:hypothetical protein [Metallococcus carri]NHN54812.1 hypothetical protein [Metallococcus carri]NOP37157.1 hypothetical protein [Calidifontibacter sp. DB2511S]